MADLPADLVGADRHPRTVDGWYPYPFLDPANGGYAQVAIVVVGILVGFIAISAAILAIGNARSRGQTTG